ncbi:TolC family protein [Lacunimicrobium album]
MYRYSTHTTSMGMTFSGSRCGMLLLILLTMSFSGCSRGFWRKQADKDSYRAIEQHITDGRWMLPRVGLNPDPRSRFFDAENADCPPLPPDDPAASIYMQCSDGIRGYKSWHKLGSSVSVENPMWLANFEITSEMVNEQTGEYIQPVPAIKQMTLQDAIELSYIHSREYQTQLENLYLAALNLTFERFQFQVRYLNRAGLEPGGDATYTVVPSSPAATSLETNSAFGVSQFLPTGGQWAVELANNTLWLFSPNSSTSSASILSFSLVQPLFQGAGRKVAMANLTQSERDLLYAVRELARFRKFLFTNTVAGGSSGGIQASPGYLGLLTQLQSIRNQEDNIRRLERQAERLKEISTQPLSQWSEELENLPPEIVIPDGLPEILKGKLDYRRYVKVDRRLSDENLTEAERQQILQNIELERPSELVWLGSMSEEQSRALLALSNDPDFQRAALEMVSLLQNDTLTLDVTQLESQLRSQQNTLRNQQLNLENDLDRFKIFLGLPPDVFITMDDSLLRSFEFIDPLLIEMEYDIENLVSLSGQFNELEPDRELILRTIQAFLDTDAKVSGPVLGILERDLKLVEENLPFRLQSQESEEAKQYLVEQFTKGRNDLSFVGRELEEIRKVLTEMQQKLSDPSVSDEVMIDIMKELELLREDLLQRLQGLQVVQINMRVELIQLNKFSLPLEDAVGLALENRMDLMNQRALVVDARRQLEVSANNLKAVLDLVMEGDVRTPTGRNNPLDFRGASSSFRAGIAFRAPIDQIAERNEYRQTQIAYQRARRDYMALEDQIKFQVRLDWRQLKTLEANLQTAREALRFAALSYDQAVLEATEVRPTSSSSSSGGGSSSRSSGLSGQNILTGLRNILQAQNQLIAIWTNYESARLDIFRDMDLMVIDERGIWIDNFYQNEKLSASAVDLNAMASQLRAPGTATEPGTLPAADGTSAPLLPPSPVDRAPEVAPGAIPPPVIQNDSSRRQPKGSGVRDNEIKLVQGTPVTADPQAEAAEEQRLLHAVRVNQPDTFGWVPPEPAPARSAAQ